MLIYKYIFLKVFLSFHCYVKFCWQVFLFVCGKHVFCIIFFLFTKHLFKIFKCIYAYLVDIGNTVQQVVHALCKQSLFSPLCFGIHEYFQDLATFSFQSTSERLWRSYIIPMVEEYSELFKFLEFSSMLLWSVEKR